MTPQLNFVYSDVYDNHWFEYCKLLGIHENYPDKKAINSRISSAKEFWDINGEKILDSISTCSNLKWKKSEIDCYVVGKATSFSKPLTMSLNLQKGTVKDLESWVDVLTHELIHNILVQNRWSDFKDLQLFLSSLGEISLKTKNHIPVNAIHYLVYGEVFSKERLDYDIQTAKAFAPDYYKAWEIVLKKGAKNIVNLFVN